MNKIQRIYQKIIEKTAEQIINVVYLKKNKKIFQIKSPSVSNETIKFSIIIPTYNSNKKFLEACINSVINQTYQNWEICISDDHSTNKKCLETLKRYQKTPRIKVNFSKKNEKKLKKRLQD